MKYVFLILFFVTAGVLAEVYRWQDADGRVFYSDQPPPGQQVDTLDLPEREPSSLGAQGDDLQDMLDRQRHLSSILEQERKAKAAQKKALQEEEQKREKECLRMKNQMAYIDETHIFYDENEDGTRRYYSDEEGDQYRADVKRAYQEKCGSN